MSANIDKCFKSLKEKNRTALITYIMAYDPDYKSCLDIMKALPSAGADIIELGIPFSDPMADGTIIQEAALRAFKSGVTVKKILSMVSEFCKENTETPLILMSYYNPIYHYGIENFVNDAKNAGVDGFIIVDLTPEEEKEFTDISIPSGLSLIKLTAPTTNKARAEKILKKSSGFVYYISVAGVTGTKQAKSEDVSKSVARLKEVTNLPIAVGFGIKTPEQAKEIAKIADGVVVGSAIVEKIASGSDKNSAVSLVKDISLAINS